MRYYEIIITPSEASLANGGTSFTPRVYSSQNLANLPNMSALRVDLDIYQSFAHVPSQNGLVTIYGIPFSDINQAANFNLATVSIKLGTVKGLPFSPGVNGVVIEGTILMAYGNWQATDVRLNLVIIASKNNVATSASGSAPLAIAAPNLAFSWEPNTSLFSAVTDCLYTAYGADIDIEGIYDPTLVHSQTVPITGHYDSLSQFSKFIYKTSKAVKANNPNYLGATITETKDGFFLFDGTYTEPPKVKNIAYTDIVGNLTWKNIATVQAKLIMRSDLTVNDLISFPFYAPTVNVAIQAGGQRGKISFDGLFNITELRHAGSSRHPDANSWVTIIEATMHNPSVIGSPVI